MLLGAKQQSLFQFQRRCLNKSQVLDIVIQNSLFRPRRAQELKLRSENYVLIDLFIAFESEITLPHNKIMTYENELPAYDSVSSSKLPSISHIYVYFKSRSSTKKNFHSDRIILKVLSVVNVARRTEFPTRFSKVIRYSVLFFHRSYTQW